MVIFSRLDNSIPREVELDATTIDPATLILRGTSGFTWAFPVNTQANGTFQCSAKDVNKDGLVDRECHFLIPANTLSVTETKVVLEETLPTSTFPSASPFTARTRSRWFRETGAFRETRDAVREPSLTKEKIA